MATGQPVDAVTVADELRRNGLLDEIGGAPILLELQNATPAISNASRYAKIVQDTAMLRRLIGVASEIAEIALPRTRRRHQGARRGRDQGLRDRRGPDHRLDPLAQRPAAAGDGQAAGDVRARRHHHRHGHRAFTTSTRSSPACSRSTLNIIGARPAMGKTSLGLGIAANVAQTSAQAGADLLAGDGPHRADPTHPCRARPRSTRRSCAPAGWSRPTGPRSARRSTASTCRCTSTTTRGSR